jgi:hypothetical protein
MAGRRVLVLITVSEAGHITLDIRGQVNGKEGIIQILDSAKELAEQGNFGTGRKHDNGTNR